MKVFVAGEGQAELGRWAEPPEYREASRRGDGVLIALFRKAGREGQVCDARLWRMVPKYRAGGHETADQRTLRKLAVLAQESGAEVLLWGRDTDGEKSRMAALQATHHELGSELEGVLEVVGEPAHPCLEAWIVAIGGFHQHPEELSKPALKALAETKEVASGGQMVRLIEERPLDGARSPSLERFIEQLR